MFRIDADRCLVLFSKGERDLAFAFAELEGWRVISMSRQPYAQIRPEQDSPGVWCQRIERVRIPGDKRTKRKERKGAIEHVTSTSESS